MNRRNFLSHTTGAIAALFVAPFIDLGDTFDPADLVTHTDRLGPDAWLWDALLENIARSNGITPEFATGKINISLHTYGVTSQHETEGDLYEAITGHRSKVLDHE